MPMDGIKIRIDGIEITGQEGDTILEAAEKAGILIPTLCYHRNLLPSGSCRICVVEAEGSSRLIGSCHTPIESGMVLLTRSRRVLSARKATIELLIAGHTGPCVNDCNAAHCDLHNLAANLEVGAPRFKISKPRYYDPRNPTPTFGGTWQSAFSVGAASVFVMTLPKNRFWALPIAGFGPR